MKKMIAAALLALLVLFAPALGLAQTQYVYDNADLLTVSQESELQAEIEAIKAQYDYEIVLVTEEDVDFRLSERQFEFERIGDARGVTRRVI